MRCGLNPRVNDCPYYNKEDVICNNPNRCSFQEEEKQSIIKDRYVREERWYEKMRRERKEKKLVLFNGH